MSEYQVWECQICGFLYDESQGWPEDGIAPGTRWADVPDDWTCPDCGVGKDDFDMVLAPTPPPSAVPTLTSAAPATKPAEPEAPLVIVGTGLAGYNLAREWRKLDTTTELIMISADDGCFYSKPLLSTAFAKQHTPDQLASASANDMAASLSATILTETEVLAINPAHNTLTTSGATIRYSQLALAVGAEPLQPPLKGSGLAHVYWVNDLQDYRRFYQASAGKKKILLIGAGLIGSEYANDLIQSGFEVDAVDPLASVLATLLPTAAAASVQHALERAGVRYHLGAVVDRIDRHGDGIVATLSNGQTLSADLVLSAIGVKARVALAASAGLIVDRGIQVDRHLATSVPNIFALGDCANVDGQLLYFVLPLMHAARALAHTLAGQPTRVNYPAMPILVKTTLFPVVVSPAPTGAQGEWIIEAQDEHGVKALFRDAAGKLIGFALTGSCVREKDTLQRQLPPLLS